MEVLKEMDKKDRIEKMSPYQDISDIAGDSWMITYEKKDWYREVGKKNYPIITYGKSIGNRLYLMKTHSDRFKSSLESHDTPTVAITINNLEWLITGFIECLSGSNRGCQSNS